MVYSFDIFDTLITRKTNKATGIFALMQKKIVSEKEFDGLPDFVRDFFYNVRVNAENEARKTSQIIAGTSEITLDQIYDLMQLMNGLKDHEVALLKELEMNTERENMVPIWGNINLLKQYRKDGNEVYLISDMYLSSSFIRELLLRTDDVFESIPILVSCEKNRSKAKGSLYQLWIKENKIDVQKWIHIGDNNLADGIRVKQFGGIPHIYENKSIDEFGDMLSERFPGHMEIQLSAGATNKISIRNENHEMGVRIGGPILYGYVFWILENCMHMGIENLYFVARDGYVLKKIAEVIVTNKKMSIQLHYLYGSRIAWRLPAVVDSRDSFIEWFDKKCEFHNLSDLCEIFNLDDTTIYEFIPDFVCKRNGNLSYLEMVTLKHYLVFYDDFINLTLEKVIRNKAATQEYLRQEIDTESSYAFVELNGSGYTQKCLHKLLSPFSDKPIISFFYTLAGVSAFQSEKNIFYKYTYERFACEDIVETLARAPHGQTMGYTQINGRWEPILDKSRADYMVEGDYENYLSGVLDFSEFMSRTSGCTSTGLSKVAVEYIRHICNEPDKKALKFIGDMPFISSSMPNGIETYAPLLSDEDIREIYLYGENACNLKGFTPSSWRFANLRFTKNNKKLISSCLKARENIPDCTYDSKMFKNFGGRFVIYGAGMRGKRIYQEMSKSPNVEIVLWVDKDDYKYRQEGYPVEKVESVKETVFDYVLIAIANIKAIEEARETLTRMGVPQNKIC